MGRKPKDNNGQIRPPSRFKCLCEKLRIDCDHLSMTEFAEKLGRYKQSRLSQFETQPDGPPLDIVEQYADFFKLKGNDRVDFFVAALQSSDQIKISRYKLPLDIQESLFKLIAIFLSNSIIGETINKRKIDSLYGYLVRTGSDPYIDLMKAWDDVETAIANFALEGVKDYRLMPELDQSDS